MIGEDKEVGRAQVDQRADIETEDEIGDDADEMRDEDQQDELVEPDRLLLFGRGIIIPEPGIDDVRIKRAKNRDDGVAHGSRIRVIT